MELIALGAFSVDAGPYAEGDTLSFDHDAMMLSNIGQATADTVLLKLVLSPDSTLTPSDHVVAVRVFAPFPTDYLLIGPILPREPRVPPGVTPDTYYFGACVEVRGSTPEINTANNQVDADTVIIE
ncbi:MAG TPA: hypothetical protein VEY91_01010 [Candidatus Limnocylindria bacterium]|nr:hypothetical protein [Candidatus Limnocylindria bacterium]